MKSASIFVDTPVFIYAVDDFEPGKRDACRAWLAACWRLEAGRISTQVLNEYYAIVRRKFPTPLAAGDARAEIRRLHAWKPWQIDQATIEAAWAVEARHRLHHWDALMVAAAQQLGCGLLLTEDLQHGQDVDGVRIVNPFLADPQLVLAS